MNYQTLRNVLELIYFLSGPVLVIFAVVGLRQISVAREEIYTKSKREAFCLSAKECRTFCDKLIPMLVRISEEMSGVSLNPYQGKMEKFTMDELFQSENKEWLDKLLKLNSENNLGMIQLANELEASSLYFTNGIADEAIAFDSIGQIYSEIVRYVYPVIVVNNYESRESEAYPNTRKLYDLWSARLEETKLTRFSEKVDHVLKTKQNELSSIKEKSKSKKFEVIGVNESKKK